MAPRSGSHARATLPQARLGAPLCRKPKPQLLAAPTRRRGAASTPRRLAPGRMSAARHRNCSVAQLLSGLHVTGWPQTLDTFSHACSLIPVDELIAHISDVRAGRGPRLPLSALLIGDCFERRAVEHFCIAHGLSTTLFAGRDEHASRYCQLLGQTGKPILTLGVIHIHGTGSPPWSVLAANTTYMSEEMTALPTATRVARMLTHFSEAVLGGQAPTLVSAQSYAWDFARWANHRANDSVTLPRPHEGGLPSYYAWWNAVGEAHLAQWFADATEMMRSLQASIAAAAGSGAQRATRLFWRTRYAPEYEFARGETKAFQGSGIGAPTTPLLPFAFSAMSQRVRTALDDELRGVQLMDWGLWLQGAALWYYPDGLHQREFASRTFAKVLLNVMHILTREDDDGHR